MEKNCIRCNSQKNVNYIHRIYNTLDNKTSHIFNEFDISFEEIKRQQKIKKTADGLNTSIQIRREKKIVKHKHFVTNCYCFAIAVDLLYFDRCIERNCI